MKRPNDNKRDGALLILRYLDGLTRPAEERALRDRLAREPELRSEWVAISRQHAALSEILKAGHHASQEERAGQAGVVDFETSRRDPAGRRADGRSRPHLPAASPRPWGRWITGIAALLLLALGLWLRGPWRVPGPADTAATQPALTATIVAVEGAAFARGPQARRTIAVGDRLLAGEILVTEHAAACTLTCSDQTTLELGPNAELAMNIEHPSQNAKQAGSVSLQRGELRAHVEHQANRTIAFLTPHAIVDVVGTRFTLQVSRDTTKIAMQEGSVRVSSRTDQSTTTLSAGQYAVAGGGIQLTAMPLPRRGKPSAVRTTDGLIALYAFREGAGEIVRDSAPAQPAVNLRIQERHAVRWLPGGGLAVVAPTIIESAGHPHKITQACKNSNELTLEAWVKPRLPLPHQEVARIVTLSRHIGERSFMLGQYQDFYSFRLRTTADQYVIGQSAAVMPRGACETKLTHLAVTRHADGRIRAFVNGRECQMFEGEQGNTHRAPRSVMSGTFANWDPAPFNRLAIADEFPPFSGSLHPRAWLGEIFLVAIYDRALSSEHVRQNFQAGHLPSPLPARHPHRTQLFSNSRN